MNVEYTGRQTVVTPKQKQQAEVGLARIKKVAPRCTSAHVILTEDKHRMMAEVTVSYRGDQIVATTERKDMETALRDSLSKVEQQVIKQKKRWDTMRDHRIPLGAIEVA